jgi:hypothetical protein
MEPETFRLAGHCLNQLCYRMPRRIYIIGSTCYLLHAGFFDPEDGGDRFLRNVDFPPTTRHCILHNSTVYCKYSLFSLYEVNESGGRRAVPLVRVRVSLFRAWGISLDVTHFNVLNPPCWNKTRQKCDRHFKTLSSACPQNEKCLAIYLRIQWVSALGNGYVQG